MAVRVVDASAIAALLFNEPEAELVAAQIEGERLAAPSLFGFELANVCLVKCRRHPEQRGALLAGFRLRGRLGIEEYAVEHDEVLALAEACRVTHYDAGYLWLARRLAVPLVSLDRALLQAALTPPPASP